MKIDLESGVKEELQNKLLDYLGIQKVSVATNGSQKFRCINPSHPDSSPSANIIPGTQDREWKCHGCGAHGDIFTATHYLEGKPMSGPGFVEDNVMYLAKLYHINVPASEMTEDEARRWHARRAYRIAIQYMTEQKDYSPEFILELERRGWPLDRVKPLGVGQIPDYEKFKTMMLKQDGLTEQFLEQIDLLGPRAEWMFRSDRMLFAQLDHHGRPCGFGCRNLIYIKRDKDGRKEPNGPKYKNTSSVGLYEKKKLMYNLYNAKRFIGERIFLLEGYADVVSSILSGCDNVVALGGTHLTDEHIMLLRSLGSTDIVLALDGDDTGREKTGQMIDKLSGFPGIRVNTLILPPNEEENDVDSYIRKNGPEAWADAQGNTISAFTWQLQSRSFNEDKWTTYERAIKAIVPTKLPSEVYRMAEELSKELDIPLDTIRDDIKERKDMDQAQRTAEVLAFGDQLKRQIDKRPGDLRSILTHGVNFLDTIERKSPWSPTDSLDQVNKFMNHRKKEELASSSTGILLNWKIFDEKMHGIPPNDTWVVLGGKANAGKSSMCANIVYNSLVNQQNENLIVCIYTIDDSYSRFMPRLLSCHTQFPTSWISKRLMVQDKHPEIIPEVEKAYGFFADLMRQGRLYVWDVRDSNTWAFADAQIAKLRRNRPDAKILVILDNFHLLGDFSEMGESTERYSRLSKMVANSVKNHEFSLISTVEYHKLRRRVRPENQSIHRTQQLEYDSHLILHLVNYMDEFREYCKLTWDSEVDVDHEVGPTGAREKIKKRKPIVEMIVGKSKLEEFKGDIFFKFDPARCKFEEGDQKIQDEGKLLRWKHPWLSAKYE